MFSLLIRQNAAMAPLIRSTPVPAGVAIFRITSKGLRAVWERSASGRCHLHWQPAADLLS